MAFRELTLQLLPCPCRTWRCRLHYAGRLLAVLLAGALIAVQALIMTGTVHDPIGAGRPAPATTAMLVPAIQAAEQLRPADTTTAAMVTTASWTEVTCHAFASWERHPDTARLDRLITSSLHVPWKYLGGDVWQLVNDVHAQPQGVDLDEQYLYEDCNDGSGL